MSADDLQFVCGVGSEGARAREGGDGGKGRDCTAGEGEGCVWCWQRQIVMKTAVDTVWE